MKEIQITVPENQRDIMLDFFETFDITAAILPVTNKREMFVFKVEDNRTNALLHELKARGVGSVFGEISIVPVALHLVAGNPEDKLPKSPAANLEEILSNIEDAAVISPNYLVLVLLSGGLAAFGLLSNSVVIIIGSMIVAPLMGPIALTSIGIIIPGRGVFRKGLLAELAGLLITIATGFIVGVYAILTSKSGLVPGFEMCSRAVPDPNNIAFAILSGIAAGLIISKGESLSIVGVAIAASLAPPAANIGLYIAIVQWSGALNSAILLVLNILAINLSCSLMFMIFGLSSSSGISKRRETKIRRRLIITMVIVFILFIFLSIVILEQAHTIIKCPS